MVSVHLFFFSLNKTQQDVCHYQKNELTLHSWCRSRGSQKTECSGQSACPTRWPSYHSPDKTHGLLLLFCRNLVSNVLWKLNPKRTISYRLFARPRVTHRHIISLSPQRQKCFQFQMGRGPGTRHQLCDHGNSATAARSPHPTRHMCRRHWRSGANRHIRYKVHMDKLIHTHALQSIRTPHMLNIQWKTNN